MGNMKMESIKLDKETIRSLLESLLSMFAVSGAAAFCGVLAVSFCIYITNLYVMNYQNGVINLNDICMATLGNPVVGLAWYGKEISDGLSTDACVTNNAVNGTVNIPAYIVFAALMCSLTTHFSLFSRSNMIGGFGAVSTSILFSTFYATVLCILYFFSGVGKCWAGQLYQNNFVPFLSTNGVLGDLETLHPPCFWTLELFQYFVMLAFPLVSFTLTVNMGQDVITTLYLGSLVAVVTSVQILYGRYMPEAYLVGSDADKMVYRLIVHTLAMEVASMPCRNATKRLLSRNAGFPIVWCFVGERFGSMYSRLLVNAVTDEVLIAVSSVVLSVIEIGMRLTVFQRDVLLARVVGKITGSKKGEMELSIAQLYRKQLIVLQSVCELCDVTVMSAFFTFMLQPDGPLKYQDWPKVNRSALYKMGFTIEDYTITNALIQISVEVATDCVLILLENYMGINALESINFKLQPVYAKRFSAHFCMYGIFFPYLFVSQLFLFPILAEIFGSVSGYDCHGTWINYLPNSVEVTYAQLFISSQ